MKKYVLLLVVLFASTILLFAKEKKKQSKNKGVAKFGYLIAIGGCIYTDVGSTKHYANYIPNLQGPDFKERTRFFTLSVGTLGLNNHFIFKSSGREKSWSLNFYPKIGFTSHSIDDLIYVGLPLGVNYNYGNVATRASRKDYGVTVGAGMELIQLGNLLTLDEKNRMAAVGLDPVVRRIIQPYATIGLRKYDDRDRALELNVKGGYAPGKTYDKFGAMPAPLNKSTSSYWFTLTLMVYLNY
jgi:hypothetical protein